MFSLQHSLVLLALKEALFMYILFEIRHMEEGSNIINLFSKSLDKCFTTNRNMNVYRFGYVSALDEGIFSILWQKGFWATFANIIKSLQRIEILWMMVWYLSSFPSKAKNIIYITTCNETFSSFLFRAITKMLENVCASIYILWFMQLISLIFPFLMNSRAENW